MLEYENRVGKVYHFRVKKTKLEDEGPGTIDTVGVDTVMIDLAARI